MKLPGSARLHLWLGLILSVVGVLVGGYAYTGDRIYHIEFVGVAFLGFLILVVGAILAGIGQANRPRLGTNPRAEDDQEQDDEEPERLIDRLKAWLPSRDGSTEATGEASNADEVVEATLECPDCGDVFDAEGSPPFTVECPHCGHEDRVELPDATT